ncbi:MAG TPA: aminotransferase class I/II-fold pyridoxal phosphate-dependent enzyme [Candidatus Saccharimonadales bacterium]|nr:aminotransferase class I/II-fold pyridoxal phosphate-dependent enzyme [Candidatus Saccharimonadales bacterium]
MSIEDYRAQVRESDRRLLNVIKERFMLGSQIAKVKESKGIATIDPDAERAAMENLIESARKLGINTIFTRKLGELLIEQTIGVQNALRPKQSKDQLLKEIFELIQKLTSQGKKITRLEIGEPNFPASKLAVRELSATFRKKKIVGYGSSSGLLELRTTLAAELSATHHTKIEPDQVLITPGGRFAIFATISTFLSELERVIIPQPAWPAYEECADFVKGRIISIRTELADRWDIDTGKLEEELRKGAKMLVMNSPCNPTGKVIAAKKFHEIVNLARKYDTIVLSDEVYDRYTHPKPPSVLDEEYENAIYVNSFSKQFSLTGWRIAYLVSTKETALKLRRLIQTAITCVPEFIQRAALIELQKGRHEAQSNVDRIMKKMELTCSELDKIDVSYYKPDGTFYVFPKANKPKFDSVNFAKKLLQDQLVSISPGKSYGDYNEFFRLAVTLPENKISGAIRAIGKAIDAWS